MAHYQPIPQLLEQAIAAHRAGKIADAEPIYRTVIAREPQNPRALHLLAILRAETGQPEEALALIDRAIKLSPKTPTLHGDRGNILAQLNQLENALASYRKALELHPQNAHIHASSGACLRDLGRLDESIAAYRQSLRLLPDHAPTHSALSNTLREAGRLDEALAEAQRAVQLMPALATVHTNLAVTLMDLGRYSDAIDANGQAVALDPNFAPAHVNLSQALLAEGRFAEAVDSAQTAARLTNNDPRALLNLGTALIQQGRVDEAIDAFRAAIERAPNLKDAGDNLLLALHNRVQDPRQLFEAHVMWAQQNAPPPKSQPAPQSSHPRLRLRGKIRLAFVSPDLCNHPVGKLLLPVLEHLDQSRFEVTCYSDATREDQLTTQLRKAAKNWHNTARLTDDRLIQLIRENESDILFDLAGHTGGNRLQVFAQKPAPLQITWLGYPDTTGLATIDYRITDAITDPPGATEQFHTEKLLHIDPCFLCVRLSQRGLATSDFGEFSRAVASKTRPFTFASLNKFAKASPQILDLWSEILRAVPHSRFLLKNAGFADARSADHFRRQFAAAGFPMDRVDLVGQLPADKYHDIYNSIDAILDTHPYSGTATTIDALAAGLPVVTLTGPMHVSRVSASLLNAAGLGQFIASDAASYIRIARGLAARGRRTLEQRRALRAQVESSPLCDQAAFTRKLEEALTEIWSKAIDC